MSSHDPISLFGLNSDLVKDDYITNIVTSDSKNKIDPLEAYTGFIDKIKNEELNSVDLNAYNSDPIYESKSEMPDNDYSFSKSSLPNFNNFHSQSNLFENDVSKFDMNILQKNNDIPIPSSRIETFDRAPITNDNLYNKMPILGQNIGIKNYSYNSESERVKNEQYNDNNPIDSIINNYSSFNETKETREDKTYESEIDDKKLILLEKIQNLRDLLAKEEVNLENVPLVNYNSSINEIQYTYRILMIKNNRDLNIDLTGNVIKGMSKILEKVFDGKKTYFGVTLDLTGYTDTVDIQLRRLDVETEKIAGNFMNKTELNPYYKIGLYLIPGMIAHSVLKRKRQNDTIYDNDKLTDALNEIKHN